MYPIKNSDLELFKSGQRQYARLTCGELVIENSDIVRGSLTIDRYSTDSGELEIGTTIAGELDFKLYNDSGKFDNTVLANAEFLLEIGIRRKDMSVYWLPCGYFIVDECKKKRKETELICYDRMIRFDDEFDKSGITFPATIESIVQYCCERCSVELGNDISVMPNVCYIVPDCPGESATYREYLQWCAMIMGGCAYIDWNGKLRIEWYKNSNPCKLGKNVRYESEYVDGIIQITGVEATDTNGEKVVVGSDERTLKVCGNSLLQGNVQGVVSNVYEVVKNTSYLPYKCDTVPLVHLYPFDKVEFEVENGVFRESVVTNVVFKLNKRVSIAAKGSIAPVKRRGGIVTGQKVEFAVGESNIEAPVSGWSSECPQNVESSGYIWQKNTITKGNVDEVTVICVSGKNGRDGADGRDGQDGEPGAKGDPGEPAPWIVSVKKEYIVVTRQANETAVVPTNEDVRWSEVLNYPSDEPSQTVHDVYTRIKTVFGNEDVRYSEPMLDKEAMCVAEWCTKNGEILIDGSKIFAGSVTAEQINAKNLTVVRNEYVYPGQREFEAVKNYRLGRGTGELSEAEFIAKYDLNNSGSVTITDFTKLQALVLHRADIADVTLGGVPIWKTPVRYEFIPEDESGNGDCFLKITSTTAWGYVYVRKFSTDNLFTSGNDEEDFNLLADNSEVISVIKDRIKAIEDRGADNVTYTLDGSDETLVSINAGAKNGAYDGNNYLNNGGNANYRKRFTMLVGADSHGCNDTVADMVQRLNALEAVDCGVHLGDVKPEYYDDDDPGASGFHNAIVGTNKAFLVTVGNHDTWIRTVVNGKTETVAGPVLNSYNTYIVKNTVQIDKTGSNAVTSTGNCYYYKDFPEYMLRIFVLYAIDGGDLDMTQKNWIWTALNQLSSSSDYDNWTVLIVSHYPLAHCTADTSLRFNSCKTPFAYMANTYVPQMIDNWLNKRDGFSSVATGLRFAGYLCGHQHFDGCGYVTAYPDQKVISFTTMANDNYQGFENVLPRARGTVAETALTAVSVDTYTSLDWTRSGSTWTRIRHDTQPRGLYITRIGADMDYYMNKISPCAVCYSGEEIPKVGI